MEQRNDVKILLSDVSSIKTQLTLLPCNERKAEIEAIKEDVKNNTYSRIRLGGYIGGISAVIVLFLQYILPVIAAAL